MDLSLAEPRVSLGGFGGQGGGSNSDGWGPGRLDFKPGRGFLG